MFPFNLTKEKYKNIYLCSMKVAIDDKIPFLQPIARKLFDEVVFLPGNAFSRQVIERADALIIRTRTLCNRELLEGSHVKFIATATIGYDHIDTAYLKERNIVWTNCPGCNASSVGQYIESCLILLQEEGIVPTSPTIGIVGNGHVGNQVALKAQAMGFSVKLNDPPKATKEKDNTHYYSLEELARTCDVISFHTPLSFNGDNPTFHLADADFFSCLKKKPVIINAARGGVIDEHSLLEAYRKNIISTYIIDTWENEPDINLELLRNAFIGTPHIAGYSADGKCNASRMALTAVCNFFHLQTDFTITPPQLSNKIVPEKDEAKRKLQLYNPLVDSQRLKEAPEKFEYLRGNYPLRREFFD